MSYYWGLVGILMPLTLYRPAYSADALKGSILNSDTWLWFWGVFVLVSRTPLSLTFSLEGALCGNRLTLAQICEALNFYSHYHLSTLRVAPGQKRKYPTGLGFGTVVCANYWYETLGVLAMVIMTGFDVGSKSRSANSVA